MRRRPIWTLAAGVLMATAVLVLALTFLGGGPTAGSRGDKGAPGATGAGGTTTTTPRPSADANTPANSGPSANPSSPADTGPSTSPQSPSAVAPPSGIYHGVLTPDVVRLDARVLSVDHGSIVVKDFPTEIGGPDTRQRVLVVGTDTRVWLECVPYQEGAAAGLRSGDEITYTVGLEAVNDPPSGGTPVRAITQIVTAPVPTCQAPSKGTG